MTHKLYFLSALTMTALLASGCFEDDDEESTTACDMGAVFAGVIKDSIFEPIKDDFNDEAPSTHQQERCVKSKEYCVLVYGTKDHYACSEYSMNYYIKCTDDQKIDARTDNNHCGSCGNKCSENKDCVEGKCVEKNTTSICDPNDVNCKDKPDEHVTDNVCTAGARRCGSDGKTPELCEENAWKPQSACEYGCIGDGECRICQEGAKSCDTDGKRPKVCKNNNWEDQAICPNGLACVNGECGCPEGWQTCEGAEGCFDLANDANNCGACGNVIDTNNGNCLCKNSEACIATGGGSFIYHSCGTSRCCDPEAEPYVYVSGRPDCLNPGTSIFADASVHQFSNNHSAATTSATYCLKADDIAKYYPLEKDNCFALESESTHLWNADECGTKAPYQKCEVLNSMNENIQTCDLGRCCYSSEHEICNLTSRSVEGIQCSPNTTDIKGSDCCSGYAAAFSAYGSNGTHIFCVSSPDYCKNICGSDDCHRDGGSYGIDAQNCKML